MLFRTEKSLAKLHDGLFLQSKQTTITKTGCYFKEKFKIPDVQKND